MTINDLKQKGLAEGWTPERFIKEAKACFGQLRCGVAALKADYARDKDAKDDMDQMRYECLAQPRRYGSHIPGKLP